jgi:NAD(P)H-quinone oxidoreductase subunit 5
VIFSWIDFPVLLTCLMLAIPLIFLTLCSLANVASLNLASCWRLARMGSLLALIFSVLLLLATLLSSAQVLPLLAPLKLAGVELLSLNLRADLLGSSVLLLVCFVAWAIVQFSASYLAGDSGQRRYIASLMAALVAVSLVIITNNLFVLALAWFATSVAMGRLLSFYSDRPAALVAAHKKFLISRSADALLLTSLALFAWGLGSLEIDQVLLRAAALPVLPVALQVAVVLLVLAVILKCAQLPFHGWLIQVMEAPTPVSALMHAGVVNLGGFVLIRLGMLVSEVPAAQTLLVVIGSTTAVVAALVMMTRISIKVSLAWSTCAQMGFMLMQCGLGAFDLALLHLLAHSVYKAHSFLAAGGAVKRANIQQMTLAAAPVGLARRFLGAVLGVGMVAVAGWLWGVQLSAQPALWVLALVLSLALTPLLLHSALGKGLLAWPLVWLSAFAVANIYFALHSVFVLWVAVRYDAPSTFELVWVLTCFSLLFCLQSVIAAYPQGRVARRLYPWFYAGLFLDHWFTRAAFKLWPLRIKKLTLKN